MVINFKKQKKQFEKGINSYINNMGRNIIVFLEPFSTDCPNCINSTFGEKSANVYNVNFTRPVNIFPGTPAQEIIYPQPFNVSSVTGVQYNPSNPNPKILKTTVCPVCKGEGKLIKERKHCLKSLVTWNPKEKLMEESAGREGHPICRIKTFKCNYAIIREAKKFLIDGVECRLHIPPRVKGLGADHLIEAYLITNEIKANVTTNYNFDPRLNDRVQERTSDQAPVGTPINPPVIPSEDGPW